MRVNYDQIIFSCFLHFFLSPFAFAQIKPQADLDNFRGIKWGTNIAELSPDDFEKKDSPVEDEIVFIKKNEDLNVLGAKAREISYRFKENRFYGTVISFSLNQKDILRSSLKEFLGDPIDVEKDTNKMTVDIKWKGDNIYVMETLNFKYNYILLFISSKIETEKAALKRKQEIKEKIKKGF